MKNLKTKPIYFFIYTIVVLSFGLFLRPYIEKSVEYHTQKHLTQRKITYEIIKTHKYKKYELTDLAKSEGISEFNLNLDDPILKDYYLIKIRIKNEGELIISPVEFHTFSDNKYTKIIDLKYRVINPSHKTVKIAHSLPPLTWDMGKESIAWIYWNIADPSKVEGFHIYASKNRDVGYGRIDEKIITKMHYKLPFDPSKDLINYYFKITAENIGGESPLNGDVIKAPEIFAFSYYFKDVYWISPQIASEKEANGSMTKPFRTLEKGIEKTNKFATFLVKEYRDNIKSSKNISNEVKVFYKDDLEFLEGKVKFSILSGLDEGAEIDLLLLCKIMAFEPLNLDLKIIGSPDITFDKIQNKLLNITNLQPNTQIQKNIMTLLTPRVVKTYLGDNTIYLAWEMPESSQYKGVRIFRSRKRNISNFKDLGDEVYAGRGSVDETLQCIYHKRESIFQDENKYIRIEPEYLPPPKKISKQAPGSPITLTMKIAKKKEVKSPFFEDCNVVPGVTYTYTLYAYDNDDNHSYPILVNTSLDDWSPEYNCKRLGRIKQ